MSVQDFCSTLCGHAAIGYPQRPAPIAPAPDPPAPPALEPPCPALDEGAQDDAAGQPEEEAAVDPRAAATAESRGSLPGLPPLQTHSSQNLEPSEVQIIAICTILDQLNDLLENFKVRVFRG